MRPINLRRVLFGGLLVGLLLNIGEMNLHRAILGSAWGALLGVTFGIWESLWMIAAFFLLGIGSVWLYVILRDRFGKGPKTALLAGFMIWIFFTLVPGMVALGLGYLTGEIVYTMLIWRLIELPVALHAGAAPYRDPSAQEGESNDSSAAPIV